ncbi:Helix-turn-helix domain-containing protein [Zhouia amylolytica]|uniref:Helix-turn-helix domain-containing protein n=2 Tax=Zhouia amylolytica TaxID=376730 RepID=A0A1I6QNS4_9FLAO|nr:Helix-turn-helix domain-containing protein [Zhouia amylolytica]
MMLDNQFIFFFSALGAFNSLLLSIYFFVLGKPRQVSNYFLGGLLFVLSIRIWKSVFFYFNPELSKVYLQIGLSACFLIGPFLYLYVKAMVSPIKSIGFKDLLLLGLLAIFITVIGVLYPYASYPELWGGYFYKAINYQWFLFIVASVFLFRNQFSILIKKELSYQEVWVVSVISGVFIIWVAYYTSYYTSYIIGAISFSFVLYLSILLIYNKRKKSFKLEEKKEKYANQKIDEETANKLINEIDAVLRTEALYRNPNLTLVQLAKKLHMRPHIISQVVNDHLKTNFPLFINSYRIDEAKQRLQTSPNLKMEIIAEECGFNSTSTFYAAFKKLEQTTPAKYAKSQLIKTPDV